MLLSILRRSTKNERRSRRSRGARASRRHRLDLRLESLEERVVLSLITWDGGAGDLNWNSPANWSGDALPGSSDQVEIDVPGDVTITHSAGNVTIQQLTSHDNLNFSGGSLTVTQGSSSIDAALTLGSGVTLTATGTGTTFTATGTTTIDGASLSAQGGALVSLPAATSYTQNTASQNSDRTLQAVGADSMLALPNLTTIAGSTQINSDLFVQATSGGRVGLSGATAVTGGAVNLTADGAGSVLDLSALQSFQGYSYGSSSNIRATNGGTILDPALATVRRVVGLTLDGTGTISTAQITALTDSVVTISGAGTAADFSGVTDLTGTDLTLSGGATANLTHAANIDGANIWVSGGVTLALPAVTSYTQNATGRGMNRTLQASGAGSVLALPNLATIAGSTQWGSNLYLNSLAGGHVELGAATAVTGGAVNLKADGAGSRLDLPALQSFQGYFGNYLGYVSTSTIQATNGGTIKVPNLTSINTAALSLDGTGTMDTAQIASFIASSVTVNGWAADFSGMTDVTSSSFTLSGGATANLTHAANIDGANIWVSGGVTLALPAVTSYTQNATGRGMNRTLQASGAGSVLALPNLATIAGSTQWGSNLYLNSLAGGHVELGAATAVTGGAVNLKADGAGSRLDLPALQSFQGYFGNYLGYVSTSTIQATNGGTIKVPNLTSINTAALSLDGTGTMDTAQIASFIASSVTVNGWAADFSGMTDVTSSSFTLSDGGTADLDHAANIDGANISVSGGVTLALPAATRYTQNATKWNIKCTLQASGAGSVLVLPSLTTITGSTQMGSNLYLNALAGGHVELGAATAVTGGAVNLKADGAGSRLDLPALQSFQGYFGNYLGYVSTSTIQATNGGTIKVPNLTSINTAALSLDGTGTMDTAQIASFIASSVTVNGWAADFSGMTDVTSSSFTLSDGGTADLDHAANIDGANISVSGGVTLALPAATRYTQNATKWNIKCTLQASGAGSVLVLPSLTTITGSTQMDSNLYLNALAGGHVELGAATAVTGGAVNLKADGAGSRLDLPALQSFQGYFGNYLGYVSTSNIQAQNGGIIRLGTNTTSTSVSTSNISVVTTGQLVTTDLHLVSNVSLTGSGTIVGNLTNAAVVQPGDSVGALTVQGDYVQTGSGALEIELAGATSFDQLVVTGAVTLNGTLDVSLLNSFNPVDGNAFPILSFASRNGDFSTKTGLNLPNSLALNPVYDSTSLTLRTQKTTATNMSVVSTANPSVYGQSLTFSLTVAPIVDGLPTPTGTVQFQVDGTDWGSAITLVNGTAASKAIGSLTAGDHTITALYSGDTNYDINSDTLEQTVDKALLTVAAGARTKLYGAAVPTLTYTIGGFVLGENSSVVSGTPALSTTATNSSPVGAYPITVTIGTLDAANYSFSFVNSSLTVDQATLTISADSKTKLYGAAVPPLTYSISGFVLGEDALSAGVTGSPSLSTTATTSSRVRAYPITVAFSTLAAPNYRFATQNSSLSVTKAHLTVTADGLSRYQGDPNPLLTYTLTGFVLNENAVAAGVTGAPVLSTTATTASSPGDYPITVDSAGTLAAQNYDFPNLAAGTLAVLSRGSTTVLVGSSLGSPSTYGQSPFFTVTVQPPSDGGTPTGSVQFQIDGANSGSPITLANGTATSGSINDLGAGTHTIVALYSGDSVYPSSSGSFDQAVNPAVLTVTADAQTKLYGAAVPTLTYMIGGFVLGENSSVVSGAAALGTSATVSSSVGTYPISVGAGTLAATNYTFALQGTTLTVTKAHLTVTADNQVKVEGDPNPALTYTVSGFVLGEDASSAQVTGGPTLSTTAETSSPAGTYTITVGLGTLGAPNYDFPTLVNGTLTITPATRIAPDLAVFASDLTFSPTNPVPGQPVTVSAVIRNVGPADASNITVAASDFGMPIGTLIIPILGAGASVQVSFGPMVFPESYRLIAIKVDPDNAIPELNENNNEANVLLQVGQPEFSVSGATIVVQTDAASGCQGGVAFVHGRADYDFQAVPGTQDYPVQGARVTMTIEDPATSHVIASFSGSHTYVDGSFSQAIVAPAQAGTYTVVTQVTDSTVTSTAISTLVVTECPNVPLPTVPPSGTGLPTGGGSPTFGGITIGNPPAVPGDVFVFSENIVFSNQPQNVGETIFIAAFIQYVGAAPIHDVPVAINDIFPINGALYSFPIGETTVNFPASPSASTYAVVMMPWTNSARGAHIIQVAVDPSFPQFAGNDKATRLIGVGTPVNFLQLDTQVTLTTDADGDSKPSPGDTLQYTTTFTNTGASDLTGAKLVSDFDERFLLTPFGFSQGGTVGDGTISWDLGTIAAGATGSVTYQAMLKPPAQFPAGTATATNIAVLGTDQTDPIASSVSITVTGDVLPPTTTATVTPAPNASGWNNTDVGVVLSAADNPGGAGVDHILYDIDGGTVSSAAGNAVSLGFVDEGIHTVEFQAVDAAGNIEPAQSIQVMIDKTPPVPVQGGPFTVLEGSTIQLDGKSSTDALSGVMTTAWALDGDNLYDDGDPASFTGIDGPSRHEMSLRVTDNAGNVATITTYVDVINVAPTATLSNSGPVDVGIPATVGFSNPYDPSSVDTSSGFHYSYALSPAGLAGSYAGATDGVSKPFTFYDAGSYVVYGRVLDKDSGYTDYETTVEVKPANVNPPLTITADDMSRVYGQDNPPFTVAYSGFLNSDGPGVLSGKLVFSTTATARSDVGSYAITPSGLTSMDYDITFLPGTLSVTQATPAINITWENWTFDGTAHAAGGSVSGVGSPAEALGTPTFTYYAAASISQISDANKLMGVPKDAGTYTVVASYGGSTNYTPASNSATITISMAPLVITAENQSRTYGQANPAFTASYIGLVNGDTPANLDTPVKFTTMAGAGSPVGSYPITPGGATSNNYEISFVEGTLAITPAHLTVTADNQDMAHFDVVPTLTYTISGFVNGETGSVVQGAPLLATTASSTSAAGRYPITIGANTLSAANYDFPTLIGSQLTVHPKIVDVKVEWGGRSMSILGLNRDLPFANIKALDVIYSDDVTVDLADLSLTSTLTPGKSYTPDGFSYDPATLKARWTLPTALDVDRLMLALDSDGAATDGHDGVRVLPDIYLWPSSVKFSVLPGDYNADGVVNAQDMVGVRNQMQGTGDPMMGVWADLDGTGAINIDDYNAVRKNVGKRL